MSTHDSIRTWLTDEFAVRLAAVFDTMTGERPEILADALPGLPQDLALFWRQPFSGLNGSLCVGATEKDWTAVGNHILRAAGIEENDTASLKSTYLEIAGQALSGLEQALASRLHHEVTRTGGVESSAAVGNAAWMSLLLKLGEADVKLAVGFEPALLDSIVDGEAAQAAYEPDTPPPVGTALPAGNSKTFDLLLEVELPVSVSFGRALVSLKDVLKLTTGSIVELNRSVNEPVEVIVNNCVIARGEVVVVEGNFGVRIQHVVSREERLRTLN